MAHTFTLVVLTPEQTVFEGAVEYVEVPGSEGYLGVLANHAALPESIAALPAGAAEPVAGQAAPHPGRAPSLGPDATEAATAVLHPWSMTAAGF